MKASWGNGDIGLDGSGTSSPLRFRILLYGKITTTRWRVPIIGVRTPRATDYFSSSMREKGLAFVNRSLNAWKEDICIFI